MRLVFPVSKEIRHFGTSAEVSGHFGHAEVSWVRTLVGPKCLGSEVSWVRSVCTPLRRPLIIAVYGLITVVRVVTVVSVVSVTPQNNHN